MKTLFQLQPDGYVAVKSAVGEVASSFGIEITVQQLHVLLIEEFGPNVEKRVVRVGNQQGGIDERKKVYPLVYKVFLTFQLHLNYKCSGCWTWLIKLSFLAKDCKILQWNKYFP